MKYTPVDVERIVKYQVQRFGDEDWENVSIQFNTDVEAFGMMDVLENEKVGIYRVIRIMHIVEALIPK